MPTTVSGHRNDHPTHCIVAGPLAWSIWWSQSVVPPLGELYKSAWMVVLPGITKSIPGGNAGGGMATYARIIWLWFSQYTE